MNLKEAFRYQNFLDRNISTIESYLNLKGNVVKLMELHKRNAANPEAENEELDKTNESPWSTTPTMLAIVLSVLLTEKEHCATSVSVAKYDHLRKTGFDLDAQLSVNKHRQSVARIFNTLGSFKETKTMSRGTGYKFNNEGVQTPYYYDVEVTATPAFDVTYMKNEGKSLMVKAEEVSSTADRCMIETELDFTPMFNPTDSIPDIIETVRVNYCVEDVEAAS